MHEQILHLGGEREWKYMVQSYLACINYVDVQIGSLLEELKKRPGNRDTVIVLTSDHGWNLGEKTHWCKAAIWRDTTRVPFIVVSRELPKPAFATISQSLMSISIQVFVILPVSPSPLIWRGVPFFLFSKINQQPGILPFLVMARRTPLPNLKDIATFDTKMVPRNCTIIKRSHEWTNLIGNKKYQKLTKKMRTQVLAFQNSSQMNNY